MYFHWMEKEYLYTIIQCKHIHSYGATTIYSRMMSNIRVEIIIFL